MARRVLSPEELSAQSNSLYDAVNGEAPLPCALISVAFLEKSLAALLAKAFIEGETAKGIFDENSGLLRDFSGRCTLAYCLGLVSKGMFQNLQKVGTIRNAFAHSHQPIDFDEAGIAKLCKELTFPRVQKADGSKSNPLEEVGNTPRDRFMLVVTQLFAMIQLNALSQKRPEATTWAW
jgi:DNA-binding MltR family transcriptional regulator